MSTETRPPVQWEALFTVAPPVRMQVDARGTQWWQGDGPPGSIPGSMVGDAYLDNLTGDVYWLKGDVFELGG